MTGTNSNTNEEDKIRIKQDYRERLHFWTGETLTQFGTANNFFIAIGIALWTYYISVDVKMKDCLSRFLKFKKHEEKIESLQY